MTELKERIHENRIDYVLVGDYYIPDLKLPEEKRSIGRWGRMHREYLKENRPLLLHHNRPACAADQRYQGGKAEKRLIFIRQSAKSAKQRFSAVPDG